MGYVVVDAVAAGGSSGSLSASGQNGLLNRKEVIEEKLILFKKLIH